jgi:hypothetical protein
MATTTIQAPVQEAIDREAKQEVQRTVLREALNRFNHELMDEAERLLLLDRINKLRRQLSLS